MSLLGSIVTEIGPKNGHRGMSQRRQRGTHARQQTMPSFDHLVGLGEPQLRLFESGKALTPSRDRTATALRVSCFAAAYVSGVALTLRAGREVCLMCHSKARSGP